MRKVKQNVHTQEVRLANKTKDIVNYYKYELKKIL